MSTLDSVNSTAPAFIGNVGAVARDPSALERSAAWFNEPLLEGSHPLHAPAASAAHNADPQALTERFLACLCER